MPNLQIEQLKRLPRRASETWQGGWVRLPTWINETGGKPYRPWVPLWISVQRDIVGQVEPHRPEEKDFAKPLTALVQFACDRERAGYRPGRLETNDPALAEHLSGMLAEAGIEVVPRDGLPALDRCLADMAEHMAGRPPLPGPLDGAGVTVERMLGFAEAAEAFFRAAPWEHLSDEDLVHVEAPPAPAGLGFACVLGAGGHTHGLGFFASRDDYWRLHGSSADPEAYYAASGPGVWSLHFGDITELPLGDADLWEDHDLPAAGEHAYPCALCYGGRGRVRRPDAPTLVFLEGLLRALAATTEDEIDTGRWTRRVETAEGATEFTLALPDLLEPPPHEELFRRGIMPDRRAMERTTAQMSRFFAEHPAGSIEEMNEVIQRKFCGKTPDEIEFTPSTALEKAQDLCYQAFDARGRRQVQLAKRAIEICPDCADAYVILAERSCDPEKGRELYAKAVEAGERALGEKRFQEDAGHFWGMTDTRPYMRARFGLAQCLDAMGRTEEAVGHYQALLRLNPGDNQGIRFILVPKLIQLGHDVPALKVLDEYGDSPMAASLWSRALLAFRAEGDSPAARASLRQARQANPHVTRYLLAEDDLPPGLPSGYSLGSEAEAVICATELLEAWQATPGAVEWLDGQEKDAAKRTRKRQSAKRRKKRGKRR